MRTISELNFRRPYYIMCSIPRIGIESPSFVADCETCNNGENWIDSFIFRIPIIDSDSKVCRTRFDTVNNLSVLFVFYEGPHCTVLVHEVRSYTRFDSIVLYSA